MANIPPSFIQEAESAWNSATSPKSGTSRTYQNGDVLVGAIGVENAVSSPNYSLTGGSGFSWTTQATEPGTGASDPWARLFTAIVAGGQTFAPSFTRVAGGSGNWFGGNVLTFRGSDGIGAVNSGNNGSGSGAPSLTLTTQADNSAIVVFVVDWNAVDGASRSYPTVNGASPTEVTYFRDGSHYAVYGCYYADVGAAGSKSVGVSSPGGQRYVILAVEVKGAAGGGGTTTTLDAESGSVSLTGTSASLLHHRVLSAASGSVSLTGTAAGLQRTLVLSAASGSVSLTGTAAALLSNRVLAAAAGAVALTGTDADLNLVGTTTLTADSGAVAITGTPASLLASRRLSAASGSMSLTGTAADLLWSHLLTADPGSVVLTGINADLQYSGAPAVAAHFSALTGLSAFMGGDLDEAQL